MKRLTIMLAVLAFTHAVPGEAQGGTRRTLALADTPQKAAPTVADVLPVCERALQAAIDGHDARAVVEDAVKGLPDEQRAAVLGVCGVYIAGAISMRKHDAETPKLPTGGTSI